MPKHIREIFRNIMGEDYGSIMAGVKAEGKTLAPNQDGMDQKGQGDVKADLTKHKMSGKNGQTEEDLKTQLEKQLASCTEQMDGINNILSGKETISKKLPGKNQIACEKRLITRVSNIKKQLRKQCDALREIYAQNFGEGDEVAEF